MPNYNTDAEKKILETVISKLERGEKISDKDSILPSAPKTLEEATAHKSTFWKNLPVPKLDEFIGKDGEIEGDKLVENIRAEPYILPAGYEFYTLNIELDSDVQDIISFLQNNYIEDQSGKFRLWYTAEFLKWTLRHQSDLHIGVRIIQTKKIVGFIAGSVINTKINQTEMKMGEVNFLCVHPKLRTKGLAQLLIREITRRINLKGIFKAFYTADRYMPKPFCSSKFFHRALNLDKLLETTFCNLGEEVDREKMVKYYKITDKMDTKFKKMTEADIDVVYDLYMQYMEKYNFYQIFTKEEFKHIFLNNKFVKTYVIYEKVEYETDSEDSVDDSISKTEEEIVDFVSYYKLPTKVLTESDTSQNQIINAAYLFYYTSLTVTPYTLIKNAIIAANNEGLDVFNMSDIMENELVATELKFLTGTGQLHYYFYNWKCPDLKNIQVCKLTL
jgi:glycylpeptide N-tetradecanoyltransferase